MAGKSEAFAMGDVCTVKGGQFDGGDILTDGLRFIDCTFNGVTLHHTQELAPVFDSSCTLTSCKVMRSRTDMKTESVPRASLPDVVYRHLPRQYVDEAVLRDTIRFSSLEACGAHDRSDSARFDDQEGDLTTYEFHKSFMDASEMPERYKKKFHIPNGQYISFSRSGRSVRYVSPIGYLLCFSLTKESRSLFKEANATFAVRDIAGFVDHLGLTMMKLGASGMLLNHVRYTGREIEEDELAGAEPDPLFVKDVDHAGEREYRMYWTNPIMRGKNVTLTVPGLSRFLELID
jgi:hypothetical protein